MSLETILSALSKEEYVLTATSLQTQYALEAFEVAERRAKKTLSINPNIISFSGFKQKLWHALLDSSYSLPRLLSSHQQKQIWIKILKAHLNEGESPDFYLPSIKQSYQYLKTHLLSLEDFSLSDDEQFSQKIILAYEAYCRANNLADDFLWDDRLVSILETDSNIQISLPEWPKTLYLYGFYQLTAREKRLILGFQKQNIKIETIPISPIESKVLRYQYEAISDELIGLRACLEEAVLSGKERIACVLPKLASRYDSLKPQFETLPCAYHVNLPFADQAIIRLALVILQLVKYRLSKDSWSILLRSPLITGSEEEWIERARLAESFDEKNATSYTKEAMLRLAKPCPKWLALLERIPDCRGRRSLSEWLQIFENLLQVFSWSRVGEELSEFNQDLYENFHDVLIEFCNLDLIYTSLDATEAYDLLFELTAAWRFQWLPSHAQIHFYSPEDAYGLVFDALYFADCQESYFPAAVKSLPLLPREFKRDESLPFLSHAWMMAYSENLLSHLLHSATQVRVSCSNFEEDLMLRPSRFILNYPLQSLPANALQVPLALPTSYIEEINGEPLIDGVLKGGSEIFRDQSHCAFKGYMVSRFAVKPLNRLSEALSPKDKGILLHRALEILFHELKTQSAIYELRDEDRAILLSRVIDQALMHFFKQWEGSKESAYLALEKTRLKKLLSAWLEIEKNRSHFSVYALEKPLSISIEGLDFNLRIDRIDQLEGEKYYIIDYKTSAQIEMDWFKERLTNPQMLLYGVFSDLAVEGLVFARLRSGDLGFKGIAVESEIPAVSLIEKKVKAEDDAHTIWREQMNKWHEALKSLAREIKMGYAVLNPVDALTCERCFLHSVCRIYD